MNFSASPLTFSCWQRSLPAFAMPTRVRRLPLTAHPLPAEIAAVLRPVTSDKAVQGSARGEVRS